MTTTQHTAPPLEKLLRDCHRCHRQRTTFIYVRDAVRQGWRLYRCAACGHERFVEARNGQ